MSSWRHTSYFIAGLILIIIGWMAVNPGGRIYAVYDLRGYNPVISKFFPNGRMSEPKKSSGGWEQEVLAEPIYFTVRSFRHLETANIKIIYKGLTPEPWRFGVLVDDKLAPSSYRYYDLRPDKNISNPDDWREVSVDVNLKNAILQNSYYRFMLSMPQHDFIKNRLSFRQISVEMRGEPLSVSAMINKTIKRLDSCFFYACPKD